MKVSRIEDMTSGWFVGAFEPSAMRTDACEVAVKRHEVGYRLEDHYHAIATEATLVLSGQARMMGRDCAPGEIIVVEPGETSNFLAVTDVVLVVVKIPSVQSDKYPSKVAGPEKAA
jgi:quercetin dioxygenase-like cupin family protein